ncbi:TELO2-interacting protein 2 [Pholidichthys leucotaenia]
MCRFRLWNHSVGQGEKMSRGGFPGSGEKTSRMAADGSRQPRSVGASQRRMDLSSLLLSLHLSSPSEKPRPSATPPPITELLSQLQEKLIGSSTDSCSLIGGVEQLFQDADPNWLFSPPDLEGGWAELREVYGCLIRSLTGCAALALCEDDCSPLSASAYQSVPPRAVAISSALTALLRTLGDWERGGGASGGAMGLVLTMAPPICVFAVTHFQDQPWTSASSRAAARLLQEELLRVGGWRNSAHLLMGDTEEEEEKKTKGVLGGVLDELQPQLKKEWFHRNEAVKLLFSWTLLQVTRPSLSHHLPRLLPPSLLLSDHHRAENCMLGVRCLHHVVLNTPAADLRQFNQAEVVYTALLRHLYTTEAAVIQLVLSCLLDLLLVLENPPSSITSSCSRRKSCRHDDVLRLILTHMEAESKVALRRVYATALPPFIHRVGVSVCRHLRRLERVILGYLEVKDPPEETARLKTLEAMAEVVKEAWPRITPPRVNLFVRSLLRLLVDVSFDVDITDPVKRRLMDQTSVCLRLLDACSQGNVQRLLQQVDGGCCHPEVLRCLATVTVTTVT